MFHNIRLHLCYLCLLVVFSGGAYSDSSAHEVAGVVLFATGERERQTNEGVLAILKRGEQIFVGDHISTGKNGYIQLQMADKGYLSLGANSYLEIKSYHVNAAHPEKERVKIYLKQGYIRSKTGGVGQRTKENFRLNTPVAAIGIRGTDFSVRTTESLSRVVVSKGGIAMSPFSGGCLREGFGGCKGDSVRELLEGQANQYLELKKGAKNPELLEGHPEQLLPQVSKAFQFLSVPQHHDKRAREAPRRTKLVGLSGDVERLLTEALRQDADKLKQEGSSLLDSDQDGLLDAVDSDRDNDLIANSLERRWLLNPLSADTDNDGLDDLTELRIETNPLRADTDGDGVIDGQDSRPIERDNLNVNGHAVSADELASVQVVAGTSAQPLRENLWELVVSAQINQAEAPFRAVVSFDSANSVWWGGRDELSVIQNLMPEEGWKDVQKEWVLDMLLQAELSTPEIRSILSKWQQQPGLLIGGKTISLLIDANATILTKDRYRYRPKLNLNSVERREGEVLFKSLITDGLSGRFEAIIQAPSGEDITIQGRLDGGLLNGRIGAYSLKGAVSDSGQITAIISDGTQEKVAQMILSGKSAQKLENRLIVEAQADRSIDWGRWSDFAKLDPQAINQLESEGGELIYNSHFSLRQQQADNYNRPETGQYSFDLRDSEAIYVRDSHIETALVESAGLDIDLTENRYALHMGVTAPNLPQVEVLRSFGSIGDRGQMVSDNILSNTVSEGFLGNGAQHVDLLFEKTIGESEYISGVSSWGRKE